MVYAEFLIPIVGRTLELLAVDAIHHYGILGQDGMMYYRATTVDDGLLGDSAALLAQLAASRDSTQFPVVNQSWFLRIVRRKSITRLVVELASGELMVVALNEWLTDAAAQKLADFIESYLWEQQSGMPRRRGGYGHPYGMPIASAIPTSPLAWAQPRPIAAWPTKF